MKIAFIFTSLNAVLIYDFHIFTTVYWSVHRYIWNQLNDQLPVSLLAQLIEHCTGIAEVMVQIPYRPEFFSGLLFTTSQVVFITAKITFTAVQIYDFHIFTTVHSSLHGFIWNQHSDQLPGGMLAQLVEHCSGIAEVMGSSVHYCEDRFHTHVFNRSSNIWLPHIHNRLKPHLKMMALEIKLSVP